MTDCMRMGKDGVWRYYIGGREVTQARYEELYPPPRSAGGAPALHQWKRPMEMDSLAVHPDDVPAQMEKDRRHGLAIDYNQDGCPIIHSERQKREYMKYRGQLMAGAPIHDRNAYS